MKKLLVPGAILGALLLMSAAKKPSRDEELQTLKDKLVLHYDGNVSEPEAATRITNAIFKMSYQETVVLYSFVFTYQETLDFLPTKLRSDLRNLNLKYNLFT